MAKKIQGITIEIDGDTSKLNKAIRGLNAPINAVNNELKNLNQALKLNPGNVDLLSQKQDVLKRNIEATTNKLNQLKEAQKQFGDYNSLTEQQKASYNRLSLEIAKSENSLKDMNNELKNMGKTDLTKLKNTMKNVGDVALDVAKQVGKVVSVVSGAMTSVVGLGVKSYAELEQNIGGINKLFGDNAKDLIENSKKAFETAGLSANQYMETATSFSASLLKGLGGDTQKAVGLTDRAIQDMSDNANTFGTSMDEVMNVYKALSKEQYTTLDNLRLGYAGTKKGMKELIKDASTYTDIQKEMGVVVDSSSMSFDNIINAISVMQKHLNITGTTLNEAQGTITGSLNAMKGAFDNFLNGMGSPEQLATTINTFITQVSNAVVQLAPSILTGLTTLIETILPQITTLLFQMLPKLLTSITNMINKLFEMVSQNKEAVKKTISDLINSVVLFITENLPTIIELGLLLVVALAEGIAENLDTMIPALVECILKIVETLTSPENIEQILKASAILIVELAKGLVLAIPKLLTAVPKIVNNLSTSIKNAKDKMTTGANALMDKLKTSIVDKIPEVASKAKNVVSEFWKKLKTFITETNWLQLGKNILNGLLNGMLNFGSVVENTIKKVGKKITQSIKNFFGIASPAKAMYPLGEYITEGIGVGVEKGVPQTIREVNKAMTNLNNGIESSLNPTINPSANSNPLIVQIENFNNTRNQDIQALAEELEFYRKNSALARGGN